MIDVTIYENNGYVAKCSISGSPEVFAADLERIKAIDYQDREFVGDQNPKFWRVRNAAKYGDLVVEIGDAIKLYQMQGRFDI